MTVSDNSANLTVLPEAVRPAVQVLAQRLQRDAVDNLESLTVVGSALTADFHPQRSDINSVLVVRRRSHQLLQALAAAGRELGKRRLRAPLLMTGEYLQSSRDVFAVELLDFQLNHATVLGPDPFADLRFDKQHVRWQCERELKSALISLRQGYIRCLGKPKYVAELLVAAAGDLLPLLRALLWLHDRERPLTATETVKAAAGEFNFEPGDIAGVVAAKQQHARPAVNDVENMFEAFYRATDGLARLVDKLEVGT